MQVIEAYLEGGETFLVAKVDTATKGPLRVGIDDGVRERLSQSLEASLAPIKRMARAVVQEFQGAAPDEVTVEIGVLLSAEAGAILAKAGGECHFNVSLTWKNDNGGSTPTLSD